MAALGDMVIRIDPEDRVRIDRLIVALESFRSATLLGHQQLATQLATDLAEAGECAAGGPPCARCREEG